MLIHRRTVNEALACFSSELHPVLKRIYLGRGVTSEVDVEHELNQLLSYQGLLGIDHAAMLIAEAILQQKRIMIIGDYDTDGATSTAVGVRALKAFGATQVSFLVPNRFEYGYGLTPEIVDLAITQKPDVLITVDNGIASLDGVLRAKEYGITVIITDHHLAGDALPVADAIVNPNQPGDTFASKCMAGVGVIFYVMLAVRQALRDREWFVARVEPNMAMFLDIVALGTVADVVPLDKNNRILVQQGLRRIRANACAPGILALLKIAGRDYAHITANDLGFAVAPRLNAAGRLDDMSLGIRCLTSDADGDVMQMAERLNQLNDERREIESDMQQQAEAALSVLKIADQQLPKGLCLYEPTWHQGVIGIVAARIKERYHRPVIAFAMASDTELKGSARSIPGFHMRDAFEAIARNQPGLITRFGGHAMAAGLTLHPAQYERFKVCFAEYAEQQLSAEQLQQTLLTDGELTTDDLSLALAQVLRFASPWGQHFPEPRFEGEFILLDQRLVGQKHLKMALQVAGTEPVIDVIFFGVDTRIWPNERCRRVRAVYRLDVNRYAGRARVQLMVDHLQVL